MVVHVVKRQSVLIIHDQALLQKAGEPENDAGFLKDVAS